MRKLRRRVAAAMALMIIASALAGCNLPSAVTQAIKEALPDATATMEPKPMPTPTPEPTPEVIPEYTAGTVEGREYRNEFFGVGCKLDGSWVIASEEELDQLNSSDYDNLEDLNLPKSYLERADDIESAYEFIALANRGLQTISISTEDDTKLFTDYANLDIYALLQSALEVLIQTVSHAGMMVYDRDLTKVMIDDTEQPAATIEAELDGVSVNFLIVVIQRGAYFSIINITTFGGDTTIELLKNFHMIGQPGEESESPQIELALPAEKVVLFEGFYI
jgi:hypothetical protein